MQMQEIDNAIKQTQTGIRRAGTIIDTLRDMLVKANQMLTEVKKENDELRKENTGLKAGE